MVGILVIHNITVSFYNNSYVSHKKVVQNQIVLSGRKTMRLISLYLLLLQPIALFCSTNGGILRKDIKPTKSASTVSTILFDKSHFLSAGNFYLGAKLTDQGKYAFTRAYIKLVNNVSTIDFDGLAPSKVYLNLDPSQPRAENPDTNNPIFNADIKALSLMGQNPVMLLGTRNTLYTDANTNGVNQNICLVTGTAATIVYTNTQKLNDANGEATSGIFDLTATSNYIFTAVKPNTGAFGATNSGIIIVRPNATGLVPNNTADGTTGNKAKDFSEAGTNFNLSEQIAMHWDNSLGRLFVGLRITRSSGTDPAHGLLIGRVAAGTDGQPKLVFEPALPTDAMLTDGTQIIGFTGATNRIAAIHRINTMHTSTKKSYVIVNGGVYPSPSGPVLQTEVFAIPIVHQQYSETKLASAEQKNTGRVTGNENVDQNAVITAGGTKTLKTSPWAKVGGAPAPDPVTHMFTIGDSVYVCCENSSDKDKRGIFHSSALYGSNGLIRAWTPWQRVMGAADRVHGGSIDIPTGQFWYLTNSTPTNEWDTVKVTLWGERDNSLFGQAATTLSTEFPKTSGGVHQLLNFDEKTASFATDAFSLMVATGYKKVTLIQAGDNSSGTFAPATGTIATKTYTDNSLKNIGPICCAAVSRSSDAHKGWLFVGGYNGVAVLCDANGNGWTNLGDITTDLTNLSFKTLGSFKNVHKLVCDDTYLYILTPTKVYRIAMTVAEFSDPTSVTTQIISQQSGSNSFLDFITSNKLGLLAATNSLFRTANGGNIKSATLSDANVWAEVKSKAGFSLGPVTYLQPRSLQKGSFDAGGNLYVTAANMSTDLATIFRFNIGNTSTIDNDTVQTITEAKNEASDPERYNFYTLGEIRSAFVTDGTFGFHSLPKHFERNNPSRKVNMTSLQINTRFSDVVLPLQLSSDRYNVGTPVQNSASGAWVFPGNWGIRVNE
jgi:hypothetical protein